MSKQRHIIGRTVLELDTNQLADVWSLQEDVSRLFQQQGLEEIARLFDQLVTDEEVVRLDQLVVEIGYIDRRFLADEFIHKLLAALREALGDRLTDRLLHQSANEKIICDRTGSDWEVLLYFLRFGRLPWWCPNHSWQSWLPRWSAVMQSDTNWQQNLRKLLINHPATQQRLVEQFPESFRHQLILQLQPTWINWHTLLTQAKQLVQSLELGRDAGRYLERQAWLLLLEEIRTDNAPTRPFPTTWNGRWLAQLMQMVDKRQRAGEQGAGEEILWQRLRTNIDAVSPGERNLWLSAYNQVLNMADMAATSPAPENSPARPQTDWEVLLYFLQYGRLPWTQKSEDYQDWLPRWETVIQTETAWQMPLRELLRSNVVTRQSLVNQLPESLRHQIVLQLQPIWTNWHTLLVQAKQLMQSLNLRSDHLVEQAWLLLFTEIGTDNTPLRPLPIEIWTQKWLVQLVQIWLETPEFNRFEQVELTQEKRFDSPETTSQVLYQNLRTTIGTFPIAEHSPWLSALDQIPTTTSNNISLSGNWRETPILQADNNSVLSSDEETAGLYISQAGLVLLHPFIRLYLEAVGLLDGESFRDESAQQMAIYLLYYLATKQTDAPEYELVLPKLLCGWSLNQPVVRGLDLPSSALEEGEKLLQTVITYWQTLKSTSPDGLREGFLQREGKLTRSGDGNWKLQVEQQAVDILLGSLPWGLSMVTLPWMEGLLIVEWH
ncbi:hypothetical protein CK510_09915 [Brunnivagina elsteri CCALA 953]|uniref:Uncharacterized protein n=2 Tax=Brunnivagina TaxID=3344733 RepID=A0A2A2TK46_9CYAN|nr:hypothetical protein CK510_09915 [Calothrix elsteri CCALA 953]